MRLTAGEIARHLNGGLSRAEEVILSGLAIDSRNAKSGDLFVCIPGENADGHDYAAKALENGASAILASRPLPALNAPVIVVPDTVKAIGKLASIWREMTGAKVICVTGTAGKTTVKETLAAILQKKGKVARTSGNFNNAIGVPYSMLNADGDEDFWIIEAGISHAGDMDELGSMIRPDLALIINVGPGHVEGLGSMGVAWHKTRLLKYIAQDGVALVSADYPELLSECSQLGISPVLFSTSSSDTPYGIEYKNLQTGEHTLRLNGKKCPVRTSFHGEPGIENTLAASAAASILGLSEKDIISGLAGAVPPPQRFNEEIFHAWHIVDDSYNANPLSMGRTLKAACGISEKENRPLVLVLGEMGELGVSSAKWHRELGQTIVETKPAAVFWKGGQYEAILDGIGDNALQICHVDNPGQFIEKWHAIADGESSDIANGIIVFKGSRANKLEKFLQAFRDMLAKGESNVL